MNQTDGKNSNARVLFYAGNGYSFLSFPMWSFYEVCQKYPTVLLAEKLDPAVEKIITDKKLFPKLEKIITLGYSPNASRDFMVKKNRLLYKTAKQIVEESNPDIVVTTEKNVYIFCLYIRRIAKKHGAINVCILRPQVYKSADISLRANLCSAALMKPEILPFPIKFFLTYSKKLFGHFLYYWILPVAVGEAPFRKEPGCLLFGKNFGRSADYYVTFSREDYDLCIKEGMPAGKLYILTNPRPSGYGKVEKVLTDCFLSGKSGRIKDGEKILTWMYPNSEVGFEKGSHNIISKEELKKERLRTAASIAKILKDWKIFIKLHPNVKPRHLSEVKNYFSAFPNVEVADPSGWAEGYIQVSDVILGSPPYSITVYTAALACPGKIILSLDFKKEFLGDAYKNFEGVEYIDSEDKFENLLSAIKDGTYKKMAMPQSKEPASREEFPDLTGLLGSLSLK